MYRRSNNFVKWKAVFLIDIPCHPDFLIDMSQVETVGNEGDIKSVPSLSQVLSQVMNHDDGKVEQAFKVMLACMEERDIQYLQTVTQIVNRTRLRTNIIHPLLKADVLEMTIPDKPTSSKQKYKLTTKGVDLLKTK